VIRRQKGIKSALEIGLTDAVVRKVWQHFLSWSDKSVYMLSRIWSMFIDSRSVILVNEHAVLVVSKNISKLQLSTADMHCGRLTPR